MSTGSPLWIKTGNYFKASSRLKEMLVEGWVASIAVVDSGTTKRYTGVVRHPSKTEPGKMLAHQTIPYKSIESAKSKIMQYIREKGGLKNTEL